MTKNRNGEGHHTSATRRSSNGCRPAQQTFIASHSGIRGNPVPGLVPGNSHRIHYCQLLPSIATLGNDDDSIPASPCGLVMAGVVTRSANVSIAFATIHALDRVSHAE